jgi:hypothetical protein
MPTQVAWSAMGQKPNFQITSGGSVYQLNTEFKADILIRDGQTLNFKSSQMGFFASRNSGSATSFSGITVAQSLIVEGQTLVAPFNPVSSTGTSIPINTFIAGSIADRWVNNLPIHNGTYQVNIVFGMTTGGVSISNPGNFNYTTALGIPFQRELVLEADSTGITVGSAFSIGSGLGNDFNFNTGTPYGQIGYKKTTESTYNYITVPTINAGGRDRMIDNYLIPQSLLEPDTDYDVVIRMTNQHNLDCRIYEQVRSYLPTKEFGFTSQSRIRRTISRTFSSISRIEKAIQKTFTSQSRIQTRTQKTFTSQSNITSPTKTKTFISQSNILSPVRTATFTSQSSVSRKITRTFNSQSRIQRSVRREFTSHSCVQRTIGKTFTSQSRIKVVSPVKAPSVWDKKDKKETTWRKPLVEWK